MDYIHHKASTKIFPANNPYFDARIETAENMRQIWIMIKPIVPRNLFVEKSEFKFWVALQNLSNSNKIRTMFFNSSYGSTIEECSYVYFLYNPQQKPYTILEILKCN